MTNELVLRKLIDLPPRLTTALGAVSARYGQIEHLLTMTIHRTEALSYNEAYAEAEKIRYRDKIRKRVKKSFRVWAIQKFGESEGAHHADKFDDLIHDWIDLADRRDDVIHCSWSEGAENRDLTGTRKGKLLAESGRPLGIEDVERLAENLKLFLVLLNRETMPETLAGPEEQLANLPKQFTPDYRVPLAIESFATGASTPPGFFTVMGGTSTKT